MNFIKALSKLRKFFWLLVILIPCGNLASQKPFNFNTEPLISSFPVPDAIQSRDIRDVVFDDYGLLYLSTYNRLYIFNGNSWKYVTTKGIPLVEKASGNRIFIADNENIGKVTVDSSYNYKIKSLSEYLPEQYKKPAYVESLVSDGRKIYLRIGDKILYLNDEHFTELGLNTSTPGIAAAGKRIILRNNGKYYLLNDGKLNENSSSTQKAFTRFSFHPEGFIALEVQTGLPYLLDENFRVIRRWAPWLSETIKEITYNRGFYFILSEKNQLLISDINGKIIENSLNIPVSNSMFNRFVPAPNGKLWLVQDKNIWIINFPALFTEVELAKNTGYIYDVVMNDGNILVATNQGLVKISEKTDLLLNKPVFRILPMNEKYILAGTTSLFVLNNQGVKKLNDYYGYDLRFDRLKNILAYRDSKGIKMVFPEHEDKNRSVTFPGVEKISEYSMNNGRLFYIIENELVVREVSRGSELTFDLPSALRKKTITEILPYHNEEAIIIGDDICFLFNGKSFFKILDSSTLGSDEILEGYGGNKEEIILTLKTDLNKAAVFFMSLREKTQQKIYLPECLRPDDIRISYVKDSLYLISGSDKIFILDRTIKSKPVTYHAIITDIISGKDTLLRSNSFQQVQPMLQKNLDHISFKNNSLEIRVHSPDYTEGTHYLQYKLEGNEKSSTFEIPGNVLRLENLVEGSYILNIRTMNSEGLISESCRMSFQILPPLYRRWWAYILYLFIIGTGLFVLYKTYILNLHKIPAAKTDEPSRPGISGKDNEQVMKKYEFISNVGEASKKDKRTRWDKYEMATVLFSDIQGFTKIAEEMNPEKLIDELDRFFFHFDSVVEKYNIEKIKTIGDAYMAAGGIPKKNITNPIEVVLAALEMQHYMKQLKKTKVDIWDLRIGIHSGPVIAGVIGSKKRSYDIWGDTVNTASRMESSGEAGKVNISGTTYNLIREYFICEYRGKIPVKYKGNVDMYFVKGLRPELSVNLGTIPNRKFYLKLQLLRIADIEKFVFNKLEEELPHNMYFHNLDYAKHLYEYSALLAKAENLDAEEDLLIRTATLLLPLGYLENYQNPETRVAQIAAHVLKEFNYNEFQINTIVRLILSTRPPAKPLNLLEKVMMDIKLEYLGRVDYIKLYKLLFLERNEYLNPIDPRSWRNEQIRLLRDHPFYTSGAQKLREISSDDQIRLITEDEWA